MKKNKQEKCCLEDHPSRSSCHSVSQIKPQDLSSSVQSTGRNQVGEDYEARTKRKCAKMSVDSYMCSHGGVHVCTCVKVCDMYLWGVRYTYS